MWWGEVLRYSEPWGLCKFGGVGIGGGGRLIGLGISLEGGPCGGCAWGVGAETLCDTSRMALLRVQTSSVEAVSFATFDARSSRQLWRVSLFFWRVLRVVLAWSSCWVIAKMPETVAHSMERMEPSPAEILYNS